MDRQINIGNRVIANFLQQKQKRRLQQRIKYIKESKSIYSEKGLLKQKIRMNSFNLQKKIQIERQNAGLFNRIASIIKQKPKLQLGSSSSLQRSRQTSILFHRKIQSSLQQQNKVMQSRINNLKPTINNKLFYKERAKHQRYLKHMGKYPYILNKKIRTQPDQMQQGQNQNQQLLPVLSKTNIKNQIFSENQQSSCYKTKYFKSASNKGLQQLFKHQSLDFTIRIILNHQNHVFTCYMQRNNDKQQNYHLNLTQNQFIQIFEQCQYDYERMISKLRLDNYGNVYCIRQKQNLKTPKSDFIKFKPNSTGYTSTGTKNNFKTSKKITIPQLLNQNQINISKSQRKITNINAYQQCNQNTAGKSQRKTPYINTKQRLNALTQNKFAEISISNPKK